MSLFTFSCSFAQQSPVDKQAIQMLKTFYINYNTAWSTTKGYALVRKLDSLEKKYCTSKLRSEQKKEGLDHDLLTNDQGTDIEHLRTLSVVKDQTKRNWYIVSYIAHTLSASYKPIDVKVVIHVEMARVGNELKIASTDMSR